MWKNKLNYKHTEAVWLSFCKLEMLFCSQKKYTLLCVYILCVYIYLFFSRWTQVWNDSCSFNLARPVTHCSYCVLLFSKMFRKIRFAKVLLKQASVKVKNKPSTDVGKGRDLQTVFFFSFLSFQFAGRRGARSLAAPSGPSAEGDLPRTAGTERRLLTPSDKGAH